MNKLAAAAAKADAKSLAVPRVESLDQFRGCLIFLMIAANMLASYDTVPDWLKHSQSFGTINLVDIGVTLFMFTVGTSLELSFERSLALRGNWSTARRFVRRDLLLIAFGIAGSLRLHRGILQDWEVFQSIGLASLGALPFVFLAPGLRLVAAALLILLFQVIGGLGWWNWLKASDIGGLGGILGGLDWAGIILFGSSLAGLVRDDWHHCGSSSIVMGIAGISIGLLLSRHQPMDKQLVTASYLALTTGIAALAAIHRCWDRFKGRMNELSTLQSLPGSRILPGQGHSRQFPHGRTACLLAIRKEYGFRK
jgi:predicted acyltransferase